MTFRFYRQPVVVQDGPRWGGPKENEHMPFSGHRTQQEVREDCERHVELLKLRKQIRSA